ncbi:diguanylate cyclase [Shewanella mangrovisoli]|uniref:diguanylate cyclase n=1 Tax=Shewanella mangrovisoli TaxID=2864211 RepID=UPI0035BA7699
MTIHIPTVFLMIITVSGTLALSVGWVTRAKQDRELLLWTVGLFLQTLTYVLFFFRDDIPSLISVLLANIILSASYSFFLAAIGAFQERRISRKWIFAPPLLLGVIFCFLMDNISARIIVSGVIFATQSFYILLMLLDRQHKIVGRGKYLMVIGLTVTIIVLAIRVASVIFNPDAITSMLHQTPSQVLTFLGVFITLILMTNGFVMMNKERADYHFRMIAMTDRLTGIWNRVRLEDQALLELAKFERFGHPISLIMLDLDNFKQINDKFGHVTGDLILKEFCAVVQRSIRTTDILARWGGEEFAVLLPNTGFTHATSLAERIRGAVENHEFNHGLRITTSAGFSTSHLNDTWNSWLERADKALYRAKAAGRNCVKSEYFPKDEVQKGLSKTNLIQLVWRSAYETGNALIDSQHRALFENANILYQAILDNSPKSQIYSLVDSLISDVEQHFKDEESIFQMRDDTEYRHHQMLHRHLTNEIKELYQRYKDDDLRGSELSYFFMYEVISQHILIEDRKCFS